MPGLMVWGVIGDKEEETGSGDYSFRKFVCDGENTESMKVGRDVG